MDEERKAFGKRLAEARRAAGYSSALAAAKALTARDLKISKGGVGAWETGRNLPDPITLRRVAAVYKTTVEAIIHEEAGGVSPGALELARAVDAIPDPETRRVVLQLLTRLIADISKDEPPPFEIAKPDDRRVA